MSGPVDGVIAVIGGGLAGLAAALRLAEAGYRPVVLETRRMLGGRATSFADPDTGQLIDNCQHVLLGCCTNLIDFYDRVGVLDEIEWHRTLYWTDGRGAVDELRASRLPAPFHLGPALRRMRLFDRRERRFIAAGMWRMIRLDPAGRLRWRGRPFTEFLAACGQPGTVVRRFWDAVVTSACNLRAERLDAACAIQVFQEGFLDNRWSYVMGLSKVPLAALYEAAREALEDAGGEVRAACAAKSIAYDGGRVTGAVTAQGFLGAAAVVSAVPFYRLERLVSGTLRRADARLRDLGALSVSPILGVHLWFDQPVMELPHLVVVDRDVQWLFNKGADAEGRQHVHAVISAADDWMALPAGEIVQRVLADVHAVLPGSKGLEPVQARAIKEKQATFAAAPGADDHRPSVEPQPARGAAVENLFLAGDWCDTGWPATMEGAVRSGYAAAAAVGRRRGRPVPGPEADVPPQALARWLGRRGR